NVAESGAAVLLRQVRTQNAQFREPGDELAREASLHVAITDDRQHLLIHEAPDAVAHGAFVFGECGIYVEQISLPRAEFGRREMRSGRSCLGGHDSTLRKGVAGNLGDYRFGM